MFFKSVLLIQFRANQATAELERASIARELGDSIQVVTLAALNTDVCFDKPTELLFGVRGVIFGGSGDYDFDGGREVGDFARTTSQIILKKLRPLLEHLFLHDIPTLGICFGHQIIGAYKGAAVVYDQVQTKHCSHRVEVVVDTNDYGICAGIPSAFRAHYGHKDSLDRIPEGAVLLMNGGEACKVSALCYRKNIYTTQFHPELTLSDLHLRVAATPGYLPAGVVVEQVFTEDGYANAILRNFGVLLNL